MGVLFLPVSVMYMFRESLALIFYVLRQGHVAASVYLCMYVCTYVQLWGCCAAEWVCWCAVTAHLYKWLF